MRNRSVSTIQDLTHETTGPGFVAHSMGAAVGAADVDAFIFAALFDMSQPTFPPHPHAGFVNQDSTGLVNAIAPGAIHFTVPGAIHFTVSSSGTVHDEEPKRPDARTREFQIWTDLPNAMRDIAPHVVTLTTDAVPVVRTDGAEIRVLAGESNGARASIDLPITLRIVEVALDAEAGAAIGASGRSATGEPHASI